MAPPLPEMPAEAPSAEAPPSNLPPAARFAALPGRAALEAMVAGRLPAPSMGRTLSFRLVAVGDGRVVFEGDTGPHLLNPMGSVHGGWALSLIDSATGCAAHSTLAAGEGFTTIETKANFVRRIDPAAGVVRAEGRVIARGSRIITADATITDSAGRLLAHGSSTLMVLAAD